MGSAYDCPYATEMLFSFCAAEGTAKQNEAINAIII
jgi:hypothetical protein